MKNQLLLIDGSSLLSTSFFGTYQNLMQTSTGIYTNGVFSMTKIILNLLKNQKPSHLVVAWDISRETFRKQMYSEYKANRSETKPELKSQFSVMQDVLDAMGIAQFKYDGFEADDIIGSLACKFENEIPVVVYTKDQDALQLINEKTSVWLGMAEVNAKALLERHAHLFPNGTSHLPKKIFEYTPTTFELEYGLKPAQMVDKKAIEGDKSDNIPGVKNVGDKASVPLLKRFGTLEEIYKYIESTPKLEADTLLKELGIKRSPIKNLLEYKEMAFLSKELATIKCDMEQLNDTHLNDLIVNIQLNPMIEKFKELEFKSLTK